MNSNEELTDTFENLRICWTSEKILDNFEMETCDRRRKWKIFCLDFLQNTKLCLPNKLSRERSIVVYRVSIHFPSMRQAGNALFHLTWQPSKRAPITSARSNWRILNSDDGWLLLVRASNASKIISQDDEDPDPYQILQLTKKSRNISKFLTTAVVLKLTEYGLS